MVFLKTPLNGFMIFFEVLGFEPVDFQTRLVVGSPRSLIRGQGKRIWHWHVPNIGKLGFKLGPSSSFRDWNRLFSTMAGNGGFKALSNLGLGSELRINVYIQQKMDQLWNLAPPPKCYVHVRARIVLPWPTKLHVKTNILDCAQLRRRLTKAPSHIGVENK